MTGNCQIMGISLYCNIVCENVVCDEGVIVHKKLLKLTFGITGKNGLTQVYYFMLYLRLLNSLNKVLTHKYELIFIWNILLQAHVNIIALSYVYRC